MRDFPTNLRDHLDRLIDDGTLAWVVAIEVKPGFAFFLTNNPTDIWYASATWQSFPIEFGDAKESGEGDLAASSITVSNIGNLPMPYLEAGDWDQGIVWRRLVWVADPDGTPIDFEQFYRMEGASATFNAVTVNLSAPNYLDRPFPGRKYIRDQGYPGILRNQ